MGLVLALYFAWSFYPFGDWSGRQFLTDLPFNIGPYMLGIVCALIMFGLVCLMLFHKEYMKEDVKAFSALKKDKSFEYALHAFVLLVLGLELFSVIFRITLLGTSKFNTVMFGIGIVGIGLSWILGKVLHAQVNRPAPVEAGRIMNEAGNLAMEKVGRDMDKLSADELREVKAGNFSPLERWNDMRNARKYKKELAKQQKQQEKDRQASEAAIAAQRNEEVSDNYLKPRDPVDFIDTSGNNVHIRDDVRSIVTTTPPIQNGTYSKN